MYTYIDLFAGCGGLSDGFEQTGLYEGIAHVEWDKSASRTLANRLKQKWSITDAEKRVLRFDVQRTNELIHGWSDETYGNSQGLVGCLGNKNKIDLLIGGPPCQAYSIAGRVRDKNGMRDDYRNYLFESYVATMEWCTPDIFVFENVTGILSASPGGVLITDRIKKSFTEAGYVTLDNFRDAVFNLEEFGVPQKRSRVVLIGLRAKSYPNSLNLKQFLNSIYDKIRFENKVHVKVCASEALSGLTKFYPRRIQDSDKLQSPYTPLVSDFLNHLPRFHSQRDMDIFRLLAEDLRTGEGKYATVESLKKLYTERTGKVSAVHKYNVIKPNEASNTIPAHLYKDGLRHIHWDPEQARSITVREAARLQSFDDDFEFLGSQGDQFKMVGNAVPPLFAKGLALSLVDALERRDL